MHLAEQRYITARLGAVHGNLPTIGDINTIYYSNTLFVRQIIN